MSAGKHIPADVFPVGTFIAEELAARNWSAQDLAGRTGLSVVDVKGIIDGTRYLYAKDAMAIGRAFETDGEVWMRLQATYNRGLSDGRR